MGNFKLKAALQKNWNLYVYIVLGKSFLAYYFMYLMRFSVFILVIILHILDVLIEAVMNRFRYLYALPNQ